MAGPEPPLKFKPKRDALQKRIRELATDTDKVIWGAHAFERVEERDITTRDALTVLRTGLLDDHIEAGKSSGEWKGKMTKVMKGRREVGVVVIVIKDAELFVKTVEWEDLR